MNYGIVSGSGFNLSLDILIFIDVSVSFAGRGNFPKETGGGGIMIVLIHLKHIYFF